MVGSNGSMLLAVLFLHIQVYCIDTAVGCNCIECVTATVSFNVHVVVITQQLQLAD